MADYVVYPVEVYYCIDCLERNNRHVYHYDSIGDCPVCGADMELQDFAIKDENGSGIAPVDSDHPIALEMLYQTRMRDLDKILDGAPLSTINDMLTKLMLISRFEAEKHPEPIAMRSGIIEDKLRDLNSIKDSLVINDRPEENIEIKDGPIY